MRLHRSVAPLLIEGKLESPDQLPKSRRNCPVYSEVTNEPHNPFRVISSHLVKVADCLFFGSIEAAYDEPLLCRYQIESVVDLSALQPNQVPRNKKSSCPCACPLQVAHSRARLTVPIQDRESQDILPYLSDINTFIHASRTKRKNVLVFSNKGKSRAPAIIIQYLLQAEKANLTRMLVQLCSLRPKMKINKGFLKALREIERKQTAHVIIDNSVQNWGKLCNHQRNEAGQIGETSARSNLNMSTNAEVSSVLKRAWA